MSLMTQPAQRSHAADNPTHFTVLKFRDDFHRISLVSLFCKFYIVYFFLRLCPHQYQISAALFTKHHDDGLVRPEHFGDA